LRAAGGRSLLADADSTNEMHLATLQDRTGAEQPADAAVTIWRDVWVALSPIIGAAGAAALYERSLFLTIAEYPWLESVSDSPESGEFSILGGELARQTKADAAAANAALLNSLSQVLGKLIGAALAARLLQPVWEKHGHSTQGSST
jgi:hypothetical protein